VGGHLAATVYFLYLLAARFTLSDIDADKGVGDAVGQQVPGARVRYAWMKLEYRMWSKLMVPVLETEYVAKVKCDAERASALRGKVGS
jgi:hypothetical protein